MIYEVLPIVVPFFGAVLLISCTTTCCLWRRSQGQINVLSERVAALESRNVVPATTPVAPPPSPVMLPQQVYMPYSSPANFYPPRATAYPVALAPAPQMPPKTMNF
jgi:hypothetical protein